MVWSVHFSISLERVGDVILKGRPSRWFSLQPRNKESSQGDQLFPGYGDRVTASFPRGRSLR